MAKIRKASVASLIRTSPVRPSGNIGSLGEALKAAAESK